MIVGTLGQVNLYGESRIVSCVNDASIEKKMNDFQDKQYNDVLNHSSSQSYSGDIVYSYIYDIPAGKKEEFKAFYDVNEAKYNVNHDDSYSLKECMIQDIYNSQVIVERERILSGFSGSSFWLYLTVTSFASVFLIMLGNSAYNKIKDRKRMSIFLLTGATRAQLITPYAIKSVLDMAVSIGLSSLMIYDIDYLGFLADFQVYANFTKWWIGGLCVFGIYLILTLMKLFSIKNINIAADLRKDEI